MFLIIGLTFGAFGVWRVIGTRLRARQRGRGAGYQVLGLIVFLVCAFAGTQVDAGAVVPRGSQLALILLATGAIPLVCGLLGAGLVVGWVSVLRPLPPRATDTARIRSTTRGTEVRPLTSSSQRSWLNAREGFR